MIVNLSRKQIQYIICISRFLNSHLSPNGPNDRLGFISLLMSFLSLNAQSDNYMRQARLR